MDPEITETALVAAVRAGETKAFEELVRRHEGPILRFLHARTGDRHLAEDLAQETFLRVWRKRHRIRPGNPLTPWFFTIARNLAVDHCRRRSCRPEVALDSATEPAGDTADPGDRAECRDTAAAIWQLAGDILPGKQFTALWLRFGEELDAAAIAGRTGFSPGNVRVLLHRALATLRDHPQFRSSESGAPVLHSALQPHEA